MVVCKFFQRGNCYYGSSCRFEHNYDSKYSYRAPQLESKKNSYTADNSSKSSGQGLISASSLFRNAAQNTATFENVSSHSFGQSQPARPSVFDRLGPQPSSVHNQGNQAKSIFAQANQNVFGQTQSTANVFQTSNQSPNVFQMQNEPSNVFQTHYQSPNIFQTHNQSPNVFQTHNHSLNMFQTSNQTSNVFQTHNQPYNAFQSQPQTANAKSLFAQATQSIFGQQPASNTATPIPNKPVTPNVFVTNVFKQNQTVSDDDIYSRNEDLSQSDIEAFESADFKLGFIPELPPPKALCAM